MPWEGVGCSFKGEAEVSSSAGRINNLGRVVGK